MTAAALLVLLALAAAAFGLWLLVIRPLQAELAAERRRTSELLDRLQSKSLAEYQAHQQAPYWAADSLAEKTPPGRWLHDPTGLQSVFVPSDGE